MKETAKTTSRSISKVLGIALPIIIILATITPFVVIDSTFFPFITGKAFYFRALVEIAALLYIVLICVDKTARPKWSPVTIATTAFMGVLGLATYFAVDPLRSFWSNYERMEGYVNFLHLFVYFIVAGATMTRLSRWWKWFFNASLVMSLIVGAYAFMDFYSQEEVIGYRISGNLGNSSYLGVYALIHIFVALYFIIKRIGAKSYAALAKEHAFSSLAFYGAVAVFNLIVLFNTGTRGSFVGLVFGLFITAVLTAIFERKNKAWQKLSIGVLTAALIFVAGLGLFKNSSFIKNSDMLNRFAELVTFDIGTVLENQGKSRSLLWGMAWEGVKDRPVLGWGLDNFHYVFAAHYDPAMYAQEQWFDRSHNVFMDWLTQAGFVGLVSYLSLFGVAGYVVWRKRKPLHVHDNKTMQTGPVFSNVEKALITGGLVAYLGHNLFVFDNLSSYVLFFSLLAFLHQIWITERAAEKGVKQLDDEDRYVAVNPITLGVVSLAGVIVFVYTFNSVIIKPYSANREIIEGIRDRRQDPKTLQISGIPIKERFAHMQKAIEYNALTNAEAYEQLAERGVEFISSDQTTAEEKDRVHEYVLAQYDNFINRTPQDPRPLFFYVNYLSRIGFIDEAIAAGEKMTALSPQKQSFLSTMAMLSVQKQAYASSTVYAKRSYDADSTNAEAFYFYLATLVYNNQAAEAEKLGSTAIGKYLTHSYIVNAYTDTNQGARIAALLEAEVAKNPSVPQLRSALASVYVQLKQPQKAIKTLEDLRKISPEYSQNIDQAIQQIKSMQ